MRKGLGKEGRIDFMKVTENSENIIERLAIDSESRIYLALLMACCRQVRVVPIGELAVEKNRK